MKSNEQSNKEVEKINQILHEYIFNKSWYKKLLEAKAVHIYNSITDDTIHKHSKAFQISEGELFVRVESPIYANQFSLNSQEIITFINKKLKKRMIRKLKFQIGSVKREENEQSDFLTDPIEEIKLSRDEMNEMNHILKSVEDQEVKSHLTHLFSSILKSNNHKDHSKANSTD